MKADDAVTSGKAAEVFARMVRKNSAGRAILSTTTRKALAHCSHYTRRSLCRWMPDTSPAVDAFAIGNAIIELGGGRQNHG